MLVVASLSLLALLQPAPSKPTPITFEKLAAARPGARVAVRAVVLPATAIQVQSGKTTRYFALAVAPDGPFFRDAAQLLDEVAAAGPEALALLAASLEDDAAFKTRVDEADKLVLRLTRLAPAPSDAIAVELRGFEGPARSYNWETVVGDRAVVPLRTPPPADRPSVTVSDAADRVQKLSELRPPALDQTLPLYAGTKLFATRAELRAYRRMVAAYNSELGRRRRYIAQLLREDLDLAVARVERILSFREDVLVGTVMARDPLAGRTFAKSAGGVPPVWLREAAAKGQAAADRLFARTTVLISSFPPGATVSVAGKALGPTPVLVPDALVGSELALTLQQTGFLPRESAEKVTAAPTGVRKIALALEPSGPPPPIPEEVWFVDGEGGRFTVIQEADIEWTSADGKTARPELILRCALGEKEVFLFSKNGFGAREGDLFIRFENESKPKKYWGAPSQNGQSLFFTGFWGKGTDGVVKAFLQHKTMTLTVKPKKKDPLPELTFDLRGLDTALQDWLKACPLKK